MGPAEFEIPEYVTTGYFNQLLPNPTNFKEGSSVYAWIAYNLLFMVQVHSRYGFLAYIWITKFYLDACLIELFPDGWAELDILSKVLENLDDAR